MPPMGTSQRGRDGITAWCLVPARQADVWARITTPEGINDEIMPFLRMTLPRHLRNMKVDEVEVGKPLCRSWFLLGGVLPVDFDNITVEALDPPRMFREHSTMLTFSDWIHERRVEAVTEEISLIHDRLSWVGRGPINKTRPMRWLQRRLLRGMFAHRHRKLLTHFQKTADPATLGT